jgi:hypothetical protein
MEEEETIVYTEEQIEDMIEMYIDWMSEIERGK